MRLFLLGLLGIIFLCGFTSSLPTINFQDDRDGVHYAGVAIGHLQVMTKNLQYQNESSYSYDNLERYGKHFGKLYNYKLLIDAEGNLKEGICPKEWRVPTVAEWEYLILGMKPTVSKNADGQMVYHLSENYAQLQFGGFRSQEGNFFFNMGKEGHYLTSTASGDNWATIKIKRNGKGYDLTIAKNTDQKRAVSCRCVQDTKSNEEWVNE